MYKKPTDIKFKEMNIRDKKLLKAKIKNQLRYEQHNSLCNGNKLKTKYDKYQIDNIEQINIYRKHIIRNNYEFINFMIPKYGIVNLKEFIFDILNEYCIVFKIDKIHKKLIAIDYGKFTINQYDNPYYLDDKFIILRNIPIDYL